MFKKWYERFKSWFVKKDEVKDDPSAPTYFHPSDHYEFVYHNGEKEVKADPIVIYRRIVSNRQVLLNKRSINEMLEEGEAANNFDKFNTMITKIREVFGLSSDLMELNCLAIFFNFIQFSNGVLGLPVLPVDRGSSQAQQPTSEGSGEKKETGHVPQVFDTPSN